MPYIVFDAETYYDKDYSLRKMTPPEYILDPRFEMIGAGVCEGDHETPYWVDGPDMGRYVKELHRRQQMGEKIAMVSHNALFDMPVLAWRYGYRPSLMIDTMGMSRALLMAFVNGVSLERIAQHLGLPPKGNAIKTVIGMNRQMIIDMGLWDTFKAYGCHDAYLCRAIFQHLRPQFPASEFEIMDMVLRCAVVPKFQLDAFMLHEHAAYLASQKQALLARCGIMDKKELMSNEKFAQALRHLGIDPPKKTSPATGNETYAFAKTDPAMVELSESDDPTVQALIAARVGHKSTIEESRTQRLIAISQLQWPGGQQGWSPIPLRYSGAHTHRLSGDWKLNPQNWSKYSFLPDGSKETGKLRRAHKAPPGYTVVKCDAAQIEARIVAWLAGQTDLVQAFRDKKDIYSEFAEQNIYHYPVSKKTVDERFVGKGSILGLGFGMGPPKFKSSIAATSFAVLGRSIILDLPMAANIVQAYRSRFPMVPAAWNFLRDYIPHIAASLNLNKQWGPVTLKHQKVILPNGMPLFYHDLKQVRQEQTGQMEWVCVYGGKPKRIFGGKMFENIVQALARIITMNAALRLKKRFPMWGLAHQVHDDIVYVVRDDAVPEFKLALLEEMSTARDWYSDLPLDAEAGEGPNYGDAK